MQRKPVTICLTQKMHMIANWIYSHHDISLSQLARSAFRNKECIEVIEKDGHKDDETGYFRTTINLPPEMDELINNIANKKGVSRSAVVRSVLSRHMQMYNPNNKSQNVG